MIETVMSFEVDGQDIDCVVKGSAVPGFRGNRSEPGHGASAEDITVLTDPGGIDVTAKLDEKQLERAADALLQAAADDESDDGPEYDPEDD